MRILIYECKKILNGKLLILLMLFTMLFYNMFMSVVLHPADNADCDADNDFAAILKEEYGYDTFLPYEDFGIVQEIYQEQIRILDKLVQESNVLQEAGIISYQQLRAAMDSEEMDDALWEEQIRIDFEDGIRQVFLKQHIEGLYEMMEYYPVMGLEKGKEMESAATFLSHRYDGYTEAAIKRVADVMKENRLSLLPESVLTHLRDDFLKFGVLLMISCLLIILPYQIKERLAGVNPLFATSNMGRRLWKKRYVSALISCAIICVLQFLIFCVVLERADILQYWNYSVNGNRSYFFWLDMNLGTYLILNTVLYSGIALGVMTIFYLISRLSVNYIAGVAISVPITVVVGVFIIIFTRAFLGVTKSIAYDLLRPIGFMVILLCVAAIIVYSLNKWDQRRDIFV